MNKAVQFISIADDDFRWQKPCGLKTLTEFFTDPTDWIKENVGTSTPSEFSIGVVEDRSLSTEKPVCIRGSGHRFKNGQKRTVFVEVGIRRQPVKVGRQSPEWDAVDIKIGHLYPFKVVLIYNLGSPADGPIEVHMEMPISKSLAAAIQTAMAASPSDTAGWLNKQEVQERAQIQAGSSSTTKFNRDESWPDETFSATDDIRFRRYVLGCKPGNTFSACNADQGDFKGNPLKNEPINVALNQVSIKSYCK